MQVNTIREQIESEFEFVTIAERYEFSGNVKVEVEEGTHGTGQLINFMGSEGYTLQNVDFEHNRFRFEPED